MQKNKTHGEWMDMALDLAKKGEGKVPGRPLVGCVIVGDNKKIGSGFFSRIGGPHAEVKALKRAGRGARDSTMYVTLEPHCFHGLTPPCTKAIIKAGVKTVFVAIKDPFPNIQGRGIKELRDTGVEVFVGLRRKQADELNKDWMTKNKKKVQ